MYPETRPQWGMFHQSPQVSTDLRISTTTNLPKKRRVTVSGANEAPLVLRGRGPFIPPSLRGLNTSATPETLEPLKLALTLKQQQKALIHARRTGKAIPSVASGMTLGVIGAGTSRSGAVTPEPALTTSFVQTTSSLIHGKERASDQSLASLASPVSRWDSSDAAGPSGSRKVLSTVAHDQGPKSRLPSPESHPTASSFRLNRGRNRTREKGREREQRMATPVSSTGFPFLEASSSTMDTALDIEMEVEGDDARREHIVTILVRLLHLGIIATERGRRKEIEVVGRSQALYPYPPPPPCHWLLSIPNQATTHETLHRHTNTGSPWDPREGSH